MPFWEIIIIIQWWSEWPGRPCELQSDWEFTKAGGRDGSRWPFEFDAPSRPLIDSFHHAGSSSMYTTAPFCHSHWLYELRLLDVSCPPPPAGNSEVGWGRLNV